MKKLAKVMSIVLVACAFVACGGSKGPDATMEKYLQKLQKNDVAGALDYIYFSKGLDEEDKQQLVAIFDEKIKKNQAETGAIKKYEITSTEISEDGNSATVYYTVTYEDGTIKEENDKLKLVDGEWLIDSGK